MSGNDLPFSWRINDSQIRMKYYEPLIIYIASTMILRIVYGRKDSHEQPFTRNFKPKKVDLKRIARVYRYYRYKSFSGCPMRSNQEVVHLVFCLQRAQKYLTGPRGPKISTGMEVSCMSQRRSFGSKCFHLRHGFWHIY